MHAGVWTRPMAHRHQRSVLVNSTHAQLAVSSQCTLTGQPTISASFQGSRSARCANAVKAPRVTGSAVTWRNAPAHIQGLAWCQGRGRRRGGVRAGHDPPAYRVHSVYHVSTRCEALGLLSTAKLLGSRSNDGARPPALASKH